MVRQLAEVMEQNKGNVPVKVQVEYKTMAVELFSSKFKIECSNQFIEQIKAFDGVKLILSQN